MDDLGLLANPEETFFQHGYEEGYAHGRIHGLIQGRALGKEKGLEIWEEVGYYKGFSSFWKIVFERSSKESSDSLGRARNHIKFILSAIDRFPMVNPSSSIAAAADSNVATSMEPQSGTPTSPLNATITTTESYPIPTSDTSDKVQKQADDSSVDMIKLLTLIRSRHKALCAILGVKHRMVVVVPPPVKDVDVGLDGGSMTIGQVGSAEGSGVIRKKAKTSLWRLDGPEKPPLLDY